MYSFSSTSHKRQPCPVSKKSGTGAFARKGLLTPPASARRERASISRDLFQLLIKVLLLLSCVSPVRWYLLQQVQLVLQSGSALHFPPRCRSERGLQFGRLLPGMNVWSSAGAAYRGRDRRSRSHLRLPVPEHRPASAPQSRP